MLNINIIKKIRYNPKNISADTHGFVLILTMLIIATSILLVSLVIGRVSTYRRMSALWVNKEKARMLALGGLQIAISQLEPLYTTSKQPPTSTTSQNLNQNGPESPDKNTPEKQIGQIVLKVLNTWQTFSLQEKIDGIDGQCMVYISSEQGKINLNKLYDFQKKQFIKNEKVDGKKLCLYISERLKPILEREKKKPVALDKALEHLFQNKSEPLDDVSQLLKTPEFSQFQDSLFIRYAKDKSLALTDLFTVSSQDLTVTPLFFSRALEQILGIQNQASRAEQDKKLTQEIDKVFTNSIIDWQKIWQPAIQSIYSIDYQALSSEIKAILATQFELNQFCVVSYAVVEQIEQKVVAIIEKNKPETTAAVNDSKEDNKKDNKNNNKSLAMQPFTIKKIYWL